MTVDTSTESRTRSADQALRERAKHVIPNGMYGHLSVNRLPAGVPAVLRARRRCPRAGTSTATSTSI